MKHYHDYKKQFSYVLIGLLFLIPLVFSLAQTKEDLTSKIDQKNSEIDKLQKEIGQYQVELNGLGKQKNSLNGSIKELDITRKKLMADISITQKKIEKTNAIANLDFRKPLIIAYKLSTEIATTTDLNLTPDEVSR